MTRIAQRSGTEICMKGLVHPKTSTAKAFVDESFNSLRGANGDLELSVASVLHSALSLRAR